MSVEADAAFERRLDRSSAAPVAVAVSGGGDSILALLATVRWARSCGRPVVALSVDHQMQPASAAWSDFVGERAARLGAGFQALAWTGPKPPTGLPAAARAARHRLLADAARALGARVLVTGHTADDGRENAILGQGALQEWTPSPVWPQGRDLFLLRPLLSLGRAEAREALKRAGETWIDDPANDDLRHPRVRARQSSDPAPAAPQAPSIAALARRVQARDGAFLFDRAALLSLERTQARRLLAAALTSAGGRERPADRARVEALLDRLGQGGEVKATLAGAKCLASETILVARDAGERGRGGLAPLELEPGRPAVWDGRYEVQTDHAGLGIDILQGRAAGLAAPERAALAALPAAIRPALPVVLGLERPTCPILAPKSAPVSLRDLTVARFLGGCGAITQESELAQGAHGATGAGVLCSSPVMK